MFSTLRRFAWGRLHWPAPTTRPKGYVDQPPLVPAVAWLVNGLIGPFAWAFRLLPALAGAASMVLTGLMAERYRQSHLPRACYSEHLVRVT